MRSMREAIFAASPDSSDEDLQALSRRVFNKVFKADIERLLSMDSMWRNRTRPVALDYDVARNEAPKAFDGDGSAANGGSSSNSNGSSMLRDQRTLSLSETVAQFSDSLSRLARRAGALDSSKDESLAFDKDDSDAMDFVTATANLRSRIYHIAPQTRFQVKEMAGNIIPAIASTNAIIAGAQVLQTLHALRRRWSDARFVSLNRNSAGRLISSITLGQPSAGCGVCQDDYVRAGVDVDRTTLGDIKAAVLRAREQGGVGFEVDGMELYEGARLLADEDFDDNLPRPLRLLGITPGMTIACADEDGKHATLNVYLSDAAKADAQVAAGKVDFGELNKLPVLRNKPTLKRPHPDSDDDDDVVEEVEAPVAPPSKRKRSADANEDKDSKLKGTDGEAAKRARLGPRTGVGEEDAIELD